MSELEKIIKREYETVVEQELMSNGVLPEEVKNLLLDRLSGEEYLKVESEILKYIIEAESCAFRQGLIRGIAVAK